jgi:fructose-1,6-bisphosphatase/inositol monophosphatase family enzyme
MNLNKEVTSTILKSTQASSVTKIELIQNLWNNYGHLSRLYLEGSKHKSVILKHAIIPKEQFHPKGFGNSKSQQRKIKSYQVETSWYEDFNATNLEDNKSLTANCLGAFQKDGEFFILLEDLHEIELTETPSQIDFKTIQLVLKWLANFHAKFLSVSPSGLWEVGTYWHLETRPDELKVLEDETLKDMAPLIDKKLNNCKFQTIVHGDAKLANFCFSKDFNQVAAVDFQYVGAGCGMKDVAYFIGSCLDEESSENYEAEILEYYFNQLRIALKDQNINISELIEEWKDLYNIACADFHRFLKGWSPGHWKINSYSEKVTKAAIQSILFEMRDIAVEAAKSAGDLIMSYYQKDFQITKKEGSSEAASVLTEVDIKSQKLILEKIQKVTTEYDLGLLAEEAVNDKSRLDKNFFWAIDPIDGTLYFSENKPGFAVSIALVSRSGKSYVGVVLDPEKNELFTATKGSGSFINMKPLFANKEKLEQATLFADRSLAKHPDFVAIKEKYDVQFKSGAVLSAINAIRTPNAYYFKQTKKSESGCTIWDVAAAQLIVSEAGGHYLDYDYNKLNLNKADTIYFHQEGLFVSSNKSRIS